MFCYFSLLNFINFTHEKVFSCWSHKEDFHYSISKLGNEITKVCKIIVQATILRQFFSFFGKGKCWGLACAITTTTTETSTTYKFKCCLFKTGDFVFKASACFAISFGLGIVSHKVFFLSEIIICSFNNNELRHAPVAKLSISCTGQFPVFHNNSLRIPGSFGTFSSCSDEVSRYSTAQR